MTFRRLLDWLKFRLERIFVRGARYQLLAVAGLIGLISVAGGVLLRLGVENPPGLADGIWWAFLRLTDPGYLGDDQGAVRRTISTALTVLGYVLFMGSLVAIMTQWLNATVRRLEMGFTPVARRHHLLILGWTARTGVVVRDLLLSEGRVRRFLRRRGARSLNIVILTEEVSPVLEQELRERTGFHQDARRIVLRSGTPLRADHLERVDFLNASVIVLPADDFGQDGAETADTRTIKTLLSISNHRRVDEPGRIPLAVAEVLDERKAAVARRAYAGPIEIVAGDAVVGRLIAQNVRHRGLSDVYNELLSQGDGNEFYVRELPLFAGRRVEEIGDAFPQAIVLGVVRKEQDDYIPYLNPDPEFTVRAEDGLVLIAKNHPDTLADENIEARAVERGKLGAEQGGAAGQRRVLVLGWNRRVPVLVREFASYPGESYRLDLVSTVALAEREQALLQHGLDLGRVELRQIEADYTVETDLGRLRLPDYDNIVMMSSDWLKTGEESDARTILGYLMLQQALRNETKKPQLLVELLDPENAGLLGQRQCEVIISPVIVGHMLALVALRREVNAVFEELFSPGGAEITFRPASAYGLAGKQANFAEVQKLAIKAGETAIGLNLRSEGRNGAPVINPPRDTVYNFTEPDEIVVLVTYC